MVVGFVETHGRPHTAGTDRRPRGRAAPRASATAAPRSRRWTSTPSWPGARRSPWSTSWRTPTCPARRNAKRWQDIEELLDAGITVITTVNIQHLESLNDVVQQITGVPQRETVPDEVVRRADQIELVDMTPEALRRRMAHGNIYAAEKVDAALGNYFRVGNLTALRELALLWVADKVDEPARPATAPTTTSPRTWETRERVVVALTGGPEGDTLIRRAARIAARTKGADLLAVHVAAQRRADRRRPGAPGPAAHAGREPRRHLPPGRRQRHPRRAARLRPRRQRHPARARRQPPRPARPARSPGRRRDHDRASPGAIDVHLVTHEEIGRGAGLLAAARRRPSAGAGGSPASSLALARPAAADRLALLGARRRCRLPSDILLFLLVVVRSPRRRAAARRCSPRSAGSCC